jgi:hypothetical protein
VLTAVSVLLVPAAVLVAVLRQWRRCLYALGVLYVLVALIEARTLGLALAGSQLVVGATALAVVFLAGRQIFRESRSQVIHGRLPAWEYLFETVVAGVGAVGAGLFARAHPLFALSGSVSFAWAWLGLAGLFMVVLASNILEVGIGLLVFDAGLNLLIVSTSSGEWWLALLVVQVLPIGLALLVSVAGIRLAHLGHGVGLDLLQEKAPFVVARSGPVRIPVRRPSSAADSLRRPLRS